MTKTTRDEARAALLALLPVGSTVYVVERHVSSSGMTWYLSLFVKSKGEMRNITHLAAAVLGEKVSNWHGYNAIKANGCGMDMHFHLVYSLARALRPQGHRCTGKDSGPRACPSNDHSSDYNRLAREFDEAYPEAAETLGKDDYRKARRDWIAEQCTHYPQRRHADAGYSLTHRTL